MVNLRPPWYLEWCPPVRWLWVTIYLNSKPTGYEQPLPTDDPRTGAHL